MPAAAIDISGASDRSLVQGTISVEGLRLVGVSAFALASGVDPADNWVEIGLMTDHPDQANRIALLASGYLGSASPIGWTGLIKGQPSLWVYCNVYSSASTRVRVGLITEAQ
jgi:hypothetical protein